MTRREFEEEITSWHDLFPIIREYDIDRDVIKYDEVDNWVNDNLSNFVDRNEWGDVYDQLENISSILNDSDYGSVFCKNNRTLEIDYLDEEYDFPRYKDITRTYLSDADLFDDDDEEDEDDDADEREDWDDEEDGEDDFEAPPEEDEEVFVFGKLTELL